MARKKATNIPHRQSLLRCQVRLAAAKQGVRVQVTAGPQAPAFEAVRMWPADGDDQRTVVLEGGETGMACIPLDTDEDFWLEVSYGGGKKNSVQIHYERKRPFGFRATQVSNPAKVDLGGSVPRIR